MRPRVCACVGIRRCALNAECVVCSFVCVYTCNSGFARVFSIRAQEVSTLHNSVHVPWDGSFQASDESTLLAFAQDCEAKGGEDAVMVLFCNTGERCKFWQGWVIGYLRAFWQFYRACNTFMRNQSNVKSAVCTTVHP